MPGGPAEELQSPAESHDRSSRELVRWRHVGRAGMRRQALCGVHVDSVLVDGNGARRAPR